MLGDLIGPPTGSVAFYDGTNLLGTASLSGDSASLSLSTLPVGDQGITAVYSGDGTFDSSTSTVVGSLGHLARPRPRSSP